MDGPADASELEAEIARNEAAGEWELVVEDLVDLASVADTPYKQLDALTRAAEVFAQQLEEPGKARALHIEIARRTADDLLNAPEAIGMLKRLVDAAPDAPEAKDALELLEALAAEAEDWESVLYAMEQHRAVEADPETRLELSRKLALLAAEALGDIDRARAEYLHLLERDPADAEAFDALEGLLRGSGRWQDLADLYAMGAATSEGPTRLERLSRLAELQWSVLDAEDAALASYEAILAAHPHHVGALDGIIGIYRRAGRWAPLSDMLMRRASSEPEAEARAALWTELARISQDRLGDLAGAGRAWQQVLVEQPDNLEALGGLMHVRETQGDWEGVVQALERQLRVFKAPQQKAAVLVALARVDREHFKDPDKALQRLEWAVELHPDSQAALTALADHYLAEQDWARAMPLLEALLERVGVHDNEARAEVYRRVGYCTEGLLDAERALEAYQEAARLVRPDRELLWSLASLSFRVEAWADAAQHYRALKEEHWDALTEPQRTQVTVHLGEANVQLGQISQALRVITSLDEAPDDAASIHRLLEVYRGTGDWGKVLELTTRLRDLTLASDRAGRLRYQIELAEVLAEKVGDEAAAIEAYKAAHEIDERSKLPLIPLVQLHMRRGEPIETVRYLVKLVALETDPRKKARWAMSIAVICAEELHDTERAIKTYEQVLELDPTQLEAFQQIERTFARAGDWVGVQKAYRRMIQRVLRVSEAAWPQRTKALFQLYRNLGEIYMRRLGQDEHAISAYELAVRENPDTIKVRLELARLYGLKRETTGRAIDQYRELLARHPERFDFYHKLSALCMTSGHFDRAWCINGLLLFFGKAFEPEERMYLKYMPPTMAEPRRNFDDEIWLDHVFSAEQDPALGNIFAAAWGMLGGHLTAKPLKHYGITRKHLVDLGRNSRFALTFNEVARILGLAHPAVYVSESRMGINIVPAMPPVLSIGPDILQSTKTKELAFSIAKQLVYLHPWHVLAAYYGEEILHLLYMAVGSTLDTRFPVLLPDGIPAEKKDALAHLIADVRVRLEGKLTPEMRSKLLGWLNQVRDARDPLVVQRWFQEVEKTANHAGLLVCNDVYLAARIIKSEAGGTSTLSTHDKIKDLVAYVLSDRYANVRMKLGLAVDR